MLRLFFIFTQFLKNMQKSLEGRGP